MWEYWKEKRGSPSEALEADYPTLLKSSIRLQVALAQVKNGQDTIDRLMIEEGEVIHRVFNDRGGTDRFDRNEE